MSLRAVLLEKACEGSSNVGKLAGPWWPRARVPLRSGRPWLPTPVHPAWAVSAAEMRPECPSRLEQQSNTLPSEKMPILVIKKMFYESSVKHLFREY